MSPRLLLRLRFVAANDNHPASVQDSGRWLGISAALALLAGLLAHFLI